jgi:hypothetical protein
LREETGKELMSVWHMHKHNLNTKSSFIKKEDCRAIQFMCTESKRSKKLVLNQQAMKMYSNVRYGGKKIGSFSLRLAMKKSNNLFYEFY